MGFGGIFCQVCGQPQQCHSAQFTLLSTPTSSKLKASPNVLLLLPAQVAVVDCRDDVSLLQFKALCEGLC